MFEYPDDLTDRILAAASAALRKPRDDLLEDLGTYLVSHPNTEALRRLLRFGGSDFPEFLFSLEDLPGRVRLAIPDLEIPQLRLVEEQPYRYTLACSPGLPGLAHVLLGLLRTMADDYGTLASLEHIGLIDGKETIAVHVHEAGYAEGREFTLAGPVAS